MRWTVNGNNVKGRDALHKSAVDNMTFLNSG